MPKIAQFIRLYFDFNTPHNFGCKSIKSVYKNSKTLNPLLPTPCQHFQPVLDQNCLRHLKMKILTDELFNYHVWLNSSGVSKIQS